MVEFQNLSSLAPPAPPAPPAIYTEIKSTSITIPFKIPASEIKSHKNQIRAKSIPQNISENSSRGSLILELKERLKLIRRNIV